MNLLSNNGISKNPLQARKIPTLHQLKECPGFENYLNLPNKKLRQAITKLRISAHKFPIETGRFDYRMRTERICPLCCDGIGDEMHYLKQCQNSTISRTRAQNPFIKSGKIFINSHKQNLLKQFWHVKMMTCYQKQDFYVSKCKKISKKKNRVLIFVSYRNLFYRFCFCCLKCSQFIYLGVDIMLPYSFSYILALIFCRNFVK